MRQSKAYREKQLWKIYRASWDFGLIPYGLVFRQLQSWKEDQQKKNT